ncbi:MAG: hypothetical protein EXR72_01290 [Myxococcales bacterium]|nr:hypothetical protein [Myxococcales bacterium]
MRRAGTLALLAALCGRAAAEPSRADALSGTPDELAGFAACEDGKWIGAGEIGRKLLRERPDAFAGHYVFGMAMHYGEGDLARAAFHLDLAIRAYDARFAGVPQAARPWRWHEAALKELAYTYGEMDRAAEEVVLFDTFDQLYEPKRLAQRVWPLMKLRRYEEARQAARAAVATGIREQKVIARSDLCAAECEAGSRERAYRACTDALTEHRLVDHGGMVEFSNASEAALSVLKYDEAERFLGEATKRAVPDSWGNPYQHLGMLLVSEGRIPEAVGALKGGQELRLRRAAWLDQHGQARLDQTLAQLLLVAGLTERAAQIARRAVDRPDRMGVTSGTERQARAAAALGLSVALRELSERHREEAAVATLAAGLNLRARALAERVASWRERRRAAVMLADQDFLERSLRPYYVGGIDVPPWLCSEVVATVGSGVALQALARARAAESLPGAAAFFDAFEAEAHFARGDDDRALSLADRALATLPHAEALLRGRIAAIAGEAARRRGDEATSSARFAIALQQDPGVFRRLGIRLPVRVESTGGELQGAAAALIEASPRFRTDGGRFGIVLASGAQPSACLLGASHEVIQCATVKPEPGESPQQGARRLVAELHRVAFALKSDLAQENLNSLDGSPTSQRADRQVKSLLDAIGP